MSEALEHRVEELEDRVESLEEKIQGGDSPTHFDDGSLASFLQKVEPANHYQRSTAIGYHLLHKEGQDSFDVNDIEDGYNDCSISKPANFSDVISGADEKGWSMRYRMEGQKQLWKITPKGDEAVERWLHE
jgi:hypothetical protein